MNARKRNLKQVARIGLVALLLSSVSVGMWAAESEFRVSGEVVIQDADTFEIGPVLIRLNGVDAPESGQTCRKADGATWDCGTKATNRLAELIGEKEVVCTGLTRDQYGRIISQCEVDGIDLGAQLILEGLAWAFVEFSVVYVPQEEIARAASTGIWSGENQPAWDYRADVWARAVEKYGDCPIKGNISLRNSEHIYHTPYSRNYWQTIIDESAGERWFCDEAAAAAAGWRAARSR